MEFDDMEFAEASVVSLDSLRRYLCFTSTLASLRWFLRLAVAILEGLRGGRGTGFAMDSTRCDCRATVQIN